MEADFSGYATKVGLECSDGRTIMPDAFKHSDKIKVPLVWQHQHNSPENILGYAVLEHRADGVYAYGFFNETARGKESKQLVKHGDITALSIYASNLSQRGLNVTHGDIREVSLVLSGANPGAAIDNLYLKHGDEYETVDDEAIIFTGLSFTHAEGDPVAPANEAGQTVQEVYDSLTEVQKQVVYGMIDAALEGAAVAHSEDGVEVNAIDPDPEDDKSKDAEPIDPDPEDDKSKDAEPIDANPEDDKSKDAESEGEKPAEQDPKTEDESVNENIEHGKQEDKMSANVFDQTSTTEKRPTLSHSQIKNIMDDGVKLGSFKESFLAHAGEYGITNIELMFPDARMVGNTPELIARQADWVPKVLDATKHAPFAKIKSLSADLTADEARAKGYIKGNEKTEEVILLLRRTTGPTTVYKKQKLDRDDILDITDFDVITWLKWEIRFMLNEELARAILVGDGRSNVSPDKIKDPAGASDGTGIRSIVNDNDLYSVKVNLAANITSDDMIEGITRARTQYRGSGSPTFYTTDSVLTDLLLLKDKMMRRLYDTEAALAAALRVKEIVAVEVLEETPEILGIVVNLVDYTIGANRGGELSFFEDFDIDFNQNKYLLETRVSGALTRPKSALVIRRAQGTLAVATTPSFDGTTNTITVPTVTGVQYLINDIVVTGNKIITVPTEIIAAPTAGYYLASNTTKSWTYAP